MVAFRDSQAGEAFVATAASRETSPEIMEAIAFFSRDALEAEAMWEDGLGFVAVCTPTDFLEHVTKNGLIEAESFNWGAEGSKWWDSFKDIGESPAPGR